MRQFSGILFFLFFFCLPTAAKAFSPQSDSIRIAVLKGEEFVRLGESDLTIVDESGRRLDISCPITVKKERNYIAVNGTAMQRLRVSAPEVVSVNGKRYRNVIEVSAVDKGLLVVNELPLEDYLVGIINCEISSQWSMEAVKAQAVVARSYAVFQREARKKMPYHLESSVLDQVYKGFDHEDPRAVRGVRETTGEVLTYDGKVVQAFFHSNCGGHTEAAENVWSFGLPYLQGVDCRYCQVSPAAEWEQSIPLKKLEALLKKGGYAISGLRGIIPLSRNKSGRISSLSILYDQGSLNIPAVDFRKTVGYTVIKSTSFEVRLAGQNVDFRGAGYGHGVGLCQWGAKKRAEDGFTYREIVSYYYYGSTLEKIY